MLATFYRLRRCNMDFNASKEYIDSLRQREFPQILRDLIDTGATEIELVIDARTADRIAYAVELLTLMEDLQNG
jgi:predicted aspartyl protease